LKVIVLGAGGFIGGWICEKLNAIDDIELLACVRRWSSAPRIARRGIEMMQVDLDSSGDLISFISSADVVINAAVPSSDREPELALRLYSACAKASVHKFIQFSSAALYGDLSGAINEDIPPAPVDGYGRGKAEMERRLLQAASRGGPQLFILRPSIVYGSFSDAWTVRYAQRIANGRLLTLGTLGTGTCNLIYAGDVARAAILCATGNAPPGSHVVNINGPDVVSWNDYVQRFGDALNIANRTTPSNIRLVVMVYGTEVIRTVGKWLLARFEKVVRSLTRSGKTGPAVMAGAKSLADLYPTLGETKLLRRRVRYDWDRAAKDLGFCPETSLDDGLRLSASWCRIHGVI